MFVEDDINDSENCANMRLIISGTPIMKFV